MPAAAASTDAAPAKPKKRDKHLYQVDFVRLVTFGSVILDHIILVVPGLIVASTGAVGMLMRYTRYSFFALTGFVLGYQYRDRELKPIEFWRRRFKLIGLPFVTWSLFYWVFNRYLVGGWADLRATVESASAIWLSAKSIGYDLLLGAAQYHLYFLSVSMQIYLLFPGILWILRRTWGYHRYILVASLAFHLYLLNVMTSPPIEFYSHGPQAVVMRHIVVTVFPYQFFVISGIVAALHYAAFQKFMVRWRWPISAGAALVIIAGITYYFNAIHRGFDIDRAANAFLVHNAIVYVAIILILYCLGTLWRERRRAGSITDTFMSTAADRSFGIYLAHPVAISALMPTFAELDGVPVWPRLLICFVTVVALTVFIVEVLRRSPISLITTGRNRLDWRTQDASRSLTVGIAAIVLGVGLHLFAPPLIGKVVAAIGVLLVISALAVFRLRQREGAPTV